MSKTGQFSVLLADDSLAMRTALRTLLEADTRFEIVGEASDGVEAVEKAGELRPNIVLLDVTMPRLSGVEALPEVLRESPHSTVVLLTAFSRETIENSTAMELDSLRGVYYMDKTREGEDLVDSIAGIASASLSTSVTADGDERTTHDLRERSRGVIDLMSRNKRFAVAGLAAAAIAALAATLATQGQSAGGSCVTAYTPTLSSKALYGRATHVCSGSKNMSVFLMGRYNRYTHTYTLGQGSTTGTLIKISSLHRCPISGTWHVSTFATRGLKSNTSATMTYSCRTGVPTLKVVPH